jgi:hypothetical protein
MPICVNNDSDPRAVKAAIRDLRRTVRLGKIAAKALVELKENKPYNKKVVLTTYNKYKKEYGSKVALFPEVKEVSRKDIPDFENLTIEFGKVVSTRMGNNTVKEVGVFVRGIGISLKVEYDESIRQSKLKKTKVQLDSSTYVARIGTLRIKKKGLSFQPNKSYVEVSVFELAPRPLAVKSVLNDEVVIARIIAKIIVNYTVSKQSIPQKYLDLEKEAEKWLVEDGVTERMIKDMFDHVHVSKVMES